MQTYRDRLEAVAIDKTVTLCEKAARTKWGSYMTAIEEQALARAVALAGNPGVALEIGCEGGRWSMRLAKGGWQMICTDIDAKSLNICQKRIPTAHCILVRPEDTAIPCENAGINLLLCIEVFPVMHADWFMREARRVLAPGGVLLGVVQNRFTPRAVAYRIMSIMDSRRRWEVENSLVYEFSYRQWQKRMVQNGFKMAHAEGFCWLPFRRSSNFFLIPELVQIERWMGLRRLTFFSPWIAFVAQRRQDAAGV
jgi:ubiquinone/menaquinone biosynthesis C-methylase UbiE